jgi:hypothetical protein
MSICKKCGVELEEGLEICPLCNNPLRDEDTAINLPGKNGTNEGYSPLTRKEKVRLFWELSTLFHFSALVVTLLIDIITNGRPSWSLYVVTSLVASYVYITLLTLAVSKLWIFLPGLLVNSLGFLALLDLLHNGMEWFINPGLPLAGFFVILLGLVMYFAYRTSQKGFNIIGFAALAIGIYCILAEIFISLAHKNEIVLSWSVIVAASILPFSLFLFFFHYRLKRGRDLRRFFHL